MMKIGVFDSGVGGFTVVKALMELLPGVPIVYFGDTARAPYGTKSRETLIKFSMQDAEFLMKHGASAIVIACHSAASSAAEALRARIDIPVFEVVTPSVKEACRLTRNRRIGIMGTRATVSSNVYLHAIPQRLPSARIFQQACPLLVPLVEEGWTERRETRMIVKRYLRPLKNSQVDTLVLGCTHYPVIKKVIQEKAGKRIKIVDPSSAVASQVAEHLKIPPGNITGIQPGNRDKRPGDLNAEHRFFVSDLTPHTEDIVANFLGQKIKLEKV